MGLTKPPANVLSTCSLGMMFGILSSQLGMGGSEGFGRRPYEEGSERPPPNVGLNGTSQNTHKPTNPADRVSTSLNVPPAEKNKVATPQEEVESRVIYHKKFRESDSGSCLFPLE